MSFEEQNHCWPAQEKHGVAFWALFKIQVANFKWKKNAVDDILYKYNIFGDFDGGCRK